MREDGEYLHEAYQEIDCFFCKKRIVLTSNDDLDALTEAEQVCWMDRFIQDLDDLGEGEGAMGVCRACAERLVGPDWQAKGRAVIAQNQAWKAAGGTEPDWRVVH